MEFCPKCGKTLTPSRVGGKAMLVCKRCGYQKPLEGEKVVIKLEKENTVSKNVAAIVEAEEAPLPTTSDVVCPQCGHNEAKWWTVQTRSADEPMTQFFRCVKCGHTWREYA
ncbi:DNA-directed RNA polymerase subunit M [Candidatus Caldarchaeum subterraneum]|uniref:DNA-directed RNA polymerase subunit M n=1 Tax=Caldiarchaeum subterraneum TaxID=311458 RepID=E6N523_CALS0|nr:DNA-directed RNA polymerase subunit M [Candidatus Caldarchaeum subterraneum]BAJ47439.1 DNA-directed RNA polymerase subunit M [Candidatus Caldarchaeum subterraneum]BAJ49239.1 DNA-directed RNA polymerase subunit M [Candidatus Caldarchaeum subterraneum]BAJ50278.1 DNA-directed RNA polymerase subunit M [Candidatus Caldarchaeum subterraneum]